MRYAHEVPAVRAAEDALMRRLPDGTLMRRAAAGLAARCGRLLPRVYGARVVLLVGSGDNGGDALYAGELLARRGAAVTAILAGSRVHAEGLAALRSAGGTAVNAAGPAGAAGGAAIATEAATKTATEAAIDAADLVVDGLVGIGGQGGLREPHARLAARAAGSAAVAVAVDVPSGVDAGTGTVAGTAFRADVTVTFGTHKPGLLIDPGASYAGVVDLVDIGLGPHLPDPDVVAPRSADVAARLPRPTAESDKYRRGVVGVVAGSERYPGAAVLTVGGAVRGGAGMVRFASVAPVADLVRQRWPEAVTSIIDADVDRPTPADLGRVGAWVIGPGLGTGERTARLLTTVLAGDAPVLVDADGITVLAARRDLLARTRAPVILTPHAGELARLLGADRADIEARRLHHARTAAAELGATVLLKGSTTLIAEAERPVRVNATGTPLLATGGTGDVLSGLIGTLLAGGMAPIDAATAGAYLHGLAARLAGPGDAPISALDVVHALPRAFGAACGDGSDVSDVSGVSDATVR